MGAIAMTALVVQTVSVMHIAGGKEKRGLASGAIVWLLLVGLGLKFYFR